MGTGLFKLSWADVKSALVSAFIVAFFAAAAYVVGVGDLFAINIHTLVNVTTLAGLTAVVSLIKSLLTTTSGNFVGTVAVK